MELQRVACDFLTSVHNVVMALREGTLMTTGLLVTKLCDNDTPARAHGSSKLLTHSRVAVLFFTTAYLRQPFWENPESQPCGNICNYMLDDKVFYFNVVSTTSSAVDDDENDFFISTTSSAENDDDDVVRRRK